MSEYLIGFPSVILTSVLASSFTMNSVKSDWYNCIRPSFAPPNWVFPVVWTGLYTSLGFALSMAIKEGNQLVINFFILNLFLNVLWCYLFFTTKQITTAYYTILILLITNFMIIYSTENPTIKKLMVPYTAWITFATALTYSAMKNVNKCS